MKRRSTIDTTDLLPITIRLPKDLKEWIEKLASDERRSFNSQAVLLFQEIKSIKTSDHATVTDSAHVEIQPPKP